MNTNELRIGQVIFENGLPVHSDEVQVLGNGVYKVTGGWRNEFTYKNITLSFLIDFKAGAKMLLRNQSVSLQQRSAQEYFAGTWC